VGTLPRYDAPSEKSDLYPSADSTYYPMRTLLSTLCGPCEDPHEEPNEDPERYNENGA